MTKAESIEAAWEERELFGAGFRRLSEIRTRLTEQQGGRCCYCGVRMTAGGRTQATLEHILPKILGGKDHEDNLVVACTRCNNRRDSKIELVHIEVFRDQGLITHAVAAALIAELTDELIDLAAERAVLTARYRPPTIRQLLKQ